MRRVDVMHYLYQIRVGLAPPVSKNGNRKKKTLFLDAFLLKKKFLLLIKDLIANLMMASDMSMILLLPSGHTASLQLIW